MHSNKNKAYRLLAAVGLMALPALVAAQGYYDDDIYYDASKATKKEKVARPSTRNVVVEIPASDTYVVYTDNTRDVDEYNRHGAFLVADTVAVDSLDNLDLFANTRRIERFHNGDIVAGSNDADLQAYYYSEPATVNIYVQNDPWYSPYWRWSWAFGSPSYYWNWTFGYYDPWWGPSWGPSWAWGWGPAWAWGPSWSWGWGPSWGWGGGPIWGGGGPAWAGRPSTGIGSSGTHRVVSGNGSAARYRTSGNASRPGYSGYRAGSNASRPGYSGYRAGSTTSRPGYSGMGTRPVQSMGTSTSRPSSTGTSGIGTGVRGRNKTGTSTRSTTNSNSYRSSSSSNRSSGFSGGFNSGGSRGGNSGGGGGGGSRGRR